MLLAVEKGTLSQYKGQILDDIEIDPEGMDTCVYISVYITIIYLVQMLGQPMVIVS